MDTEQAEPYRLSAPQATQLSQPVWTRHRDPCSCCVYELLQPLVHRNVQIDILLWVMQAAGLDPCIGENNFPRHLQISRISRLCSRTSANKKPSHLC